MLDQAQHNTKLLLKALPLIGMYLIIYSFLFIDDQQQLPSFLSLISVLGSCLVITFAQPKEGIYYLLAWKPVVFLGAISYSIYLWHQPVFVFFRLIKHDHINVEQLILLTGISVALAILSYYFVENPLRRARNKLILSSTLTILLVTIGYFGHSMINQRGYPQRFSELATMLDSGPNLPKMKSCLNNIGKRCLFAVPKSNRDLILVGDSHAKAMAPNLYELAHQLHYNFVNLSMSSCSGIASIEKRLKDGQDKQCNQLTKLTDQYIKSHPNALVVYATRMPLYMLNDKAGAWNFSRTGRDITKDIHDTINSWAQNGNQVVIMYPVPMAPYPVRNELNKKFNSLTHLFNSPDALLNDPSFLSFNTDYYNKRWQVNYQKSYRLFNSLKGKNFIKIYPKEQLCQNNICVTHDREHLYYKDDNHLSYYGMQLVVDEIKYKIL